MKIILFILSVSCLFSCAKEKENLLSENFRAKLIKYQKLYPYVSTENNQKGKKYVYTATFLKNNKDTLILFSRSTNGVFPKSKGYGVYIDSELKETFIYDEFDYSENFILKKIDSNASKYYLKLNAPYYESHPPIYTYRVKNKELNLIKIDTFWNHWDGKDWKLYENGLER